MGLQIKIPLESKIFQSFKYLGLNSQISKTRADIRTGVAFMAHLIDKKALNSTKIDMDKEINQHILRLVYKRD